MRWICIMLMLLTFSCDKDSVTSPKPRPKTPVADAGPDITTAIGNFATIDVSNSTGGPELALEYRWEQSGQNPERVSLFSGHFGEVIYHISFVTPGEYDFYLTVKTESMVSEPDTVHVSVSGERAETPIEDIHLELSIRYNRFKPSEDQIYKGILDEQYLASIDSILSHGPGDVKSLEGLQFCTSLVYLSMNLQDITDLTPIRDLHTLEYLNLSQNHRLRNLSPLRDLVNLRYLNFDSSERIKDISPLQNMVNLEYLNLMYTDIESYDAIANMISLEELTMNHIKTSDITFVSGLHELREIRFSYSDVEDISPLRQLYKLERIHAQGNKVSDISPLRDLINVRYISLEDSDIQDIEPLSGLINIGGLILMDNRIEDIKPLIDNAGIGENDTVLLSNNPLNEKSRDEFIPMLKERGVEVLF